MTVMVSSWWASNSSCRYPRCGYTEL